MPYQVTYKQNGQRLCFRYWGDLTSAEVLQSLRERLPDKNDIQQVKVLLADHSAVVSMESDNHEVREAAYWFKKLAEHNPEVKLAVIAPSDLLYGISRMWEVYLDGIAWPHMVFRSVDEAEAWLSSS